MTAAGAVALGAVLLAAGCVDVREQADERAKRNVEGKWRSVAFFSAEPLDWKGTYEFRPEGEVEIHASFKEPATGELQRTDEVRLYDVRDGEVVIEGAPSILRVRPDGRLEIVRLAHRTTRGAQMESKIVLEREAPK